MNMKLLLALVTFLGGQFVGHFANADEVQPVTQPSEMKEFTLSGFELSGSEYWIFRAGEEFVYPDHVLWGFQGEENGYGRPTPAAENVRLCAMKAYNKLIEVLRQPPAGLVTLKERGATPRFFLWTDGYAEAAEGTQERPHQMWHWNRGPKDYRTGYWKWESRLSRSGECLIPDDAQIQAKLEEVLQAFNP